MSRAANIATVVSASYRARLNRRSTTRWTRRRSGLNNAATASVEAATEHLAWEHLFFDQLDFVGQLGLTAG